MRLPATGGLHRRGVAAGLAPDALRLFVLGRFYPIFFLLFGMSFGIFLARAAKRDDRPRVLLVRRMLVLVILGALHHLLQSGEVLLPFGIVGLAVLLPLSFAPARVNLVVGLLLTVLGLLAGLGLLPGLFVLGSAMAALAVPETVVRRPRQLTGALGVSAAVAAAAYGTIVWGVPDQVALRVGLLFSLSMALAYACALLLVLRTPLGPGLTALLAPMGRMALTNYITATLLFVPIGTVLGLRGSDDFGTAAVLGAAILVVQAVWNPVWLRRFRYGPLEWLWRSVTWWRFVRLRRPGPPVTA